MIKRKSCVELAVAAGLILQLAGCVAVPPESARLSSELGTQLDHLETANMNLLKSYFDIKRQQVDSFLEEQWVPMFTTNYFELPEVQQLWHAVVKSSDEKDRVEFIVRTGPALQKQINEKRLELIRPLDELELTLTRRIHEQYNRARLMNSTITAFLLSASEVAETRERYLQMVGISDEKVAGTIDQLNAAVAGLTETSLQAEDLVKSGELFLDQLKSINDTISTNNIQREQ